MNVRKLVRFVGHVTVIWETVHMVQTESRKSEVVKISDCKSNVFTKVLPTDELHK